MGEVPPKSYYEFLADDLSAEVLSHVQLIPDITSVFCGIIYITIGTILKSHTYKIAI